MKRHQNYFKFLILAILAWLSVFSYSFYYNFSELKYFTSVLPWLLLMWFGCYCLFRLGVDLLSFNDYPNEVYKLEQVRAFNRLNNRVFLFDIYYIECLNVAVIFMWIGYS